jgi:hypothetical protein
LYKLAYTIDATPNLKQEDEYCRSIISSSMKE